MSSIKRKMKKYSKNRTIKKINRNKLKNKKIRISKKINNKKRVSKKKIYKRKQYIKSGGADFSLLQKVSQNFRNSKKYNNVYTEDYKYKVIKTDTYKEILDKAIKILKKMDDIKDVIGNCKKENNFEGFSVTDECKNITQLESFLQEIKEVRDVDVSQIKDILDNGFLSNEEKLEKLEGIKESESNKDQDESNSGLGTNNNDF
jgi:hypothetical protein